MNFICTAINCTKTFKTERGLKLHVTRTHVNKSQVNKTIEPVIEIEQANQEQDSQLFDEQDLIDMLEDTTSTTLQQDQVTVSALQSEQKDIAFESLQAQCRQIINEMIDKIVEENARVKPIWHDKINVQFHGLAHDLWIQYNCKTCVDLFDAFVLYINDMAKKQQMNKLMPFTESYKDVKSELTSGEKLRYGCTDRFISTIYGQVDVNDVRYQRVQSIKILLRLGFGNLSVEEQTQTMGPVNHDLDMCLRSHRLNSDDRIIFEVERISFDSKRTYRSVELWNLQDAVKEMSTNNRIQFNQVITSRISENVKFFMDIDIKDKMGSVKTIEQRYKFIDDLERQTKLVLIMYGAQKKDIQFEIVAKNMISSYHLYTNVVVRLEDCEQIVQLIKAQMVLLGYDINQLNRALDCGPYAKGILKSQLRFPGSQKIKQDKDDLKFKSADKRVMGLAGDFSRFLFQPKEIRNLEVVSGFHFQKISPWVNEYVMKEEESDDEDYQQQDKAFRAEYNRQYSVLCDEYNEERARLQSSVERRAFQKEFSARSKELQESLYVLYHGNKKTQTNTDDKAFQQWLSQLKDYQIDKNGSRLTYDGECPICNKTHSSSGNRVLFIKKDETQTTVRCVRSDQTLKFSNTDVVIEQIKKDDLTCWHLKDEFKQTMCQKHVHYDALSYHTTFVQSAVGTGKTTQVIENIKQFEKEHNRPAEVLFVSTRVSFSHCQVAQIYSRDGVKFDLYDDKNIEDITKCTKLMIQVESIPRLTKNVSLIKKYDFIIIDEAISVCRQINTPICRQIDVLYALKRLTQKANHVIVLDAFLNRLTKRFIQSLTGNQSNQTIVNGYKPYTEKQCEFVECTKGKAQCCEEYINRTIKALNGGESVFSFFDTRELMFSMQLKLNQAIKDGELNIKESEILVLHGLNLQRQQDDFDNVTKTHIKKKKNIYSQGDERLSQYRIVLFTKTMTVGVDSQLSKFSQGIHLLEYLKLSIPFEVVQAIHRFRQVQKQTLIHCDQKQQQQTMHSSGFTPFAQMMKYSSISKGIAQDYSMTTHDDICLEFQTLCDVTQQYLNRGSIKLIAGFMQYLGYDRSHNRILVESENKFEMIKRDRALQFVELDQETLILCEHIKTNGTNNLPERCEQLQMQELYNVYSKTRQYLMNFYQSEQITSQMILDNQERAFELNSVKSQIIMANMCLNQQFVRYDKITPLIDHKTVSKNLQQYVNSILDGYKPKTTLDNILENAKLQAKLLFLGIASIQGTSYQEHKKCDQSLEYLLTYQNDHKQLMQACINHSLPKSFNNQFINGKLLAEMIKGCGLAVKSKQIRINGTKQYVFTANVEQLPAPITE